LPEFNLETDYLETSAERLKDLIAGEVEACEFDCGLIGIA
jgi:hypothetical protein